MKVAEGPVTTFAVPGIEVQLIVPSQFEQAVQKLGYIKLLLWYDTEQPRTQASLIFKKQPFEIEGPVLEYVAILKPAAKTFDLSWAFLEDFELLKDRGLIPQDAKMRSFDFIEEDQRFLAWVM